MNEKLKLIINLQLLVVGIFFVSGYSFAQSYPPSYPYPEPGVTKANHKRSLYGPRYLMNGEKGNKFHEGIDYTATPDTPLHSNAQGKILYIKDWPFDGDPAGNRVLFQPDGDSRFFNFMHLLKGLNINGVTTIKGQKIQRLPYASITSEGNIYLDKYQFTFLLGANGLRFAVQKKYCNVLFVQTPTTKTAFIGEKDCGLPLETSIPYFSGNISFATPSYDTYTVKSSVNLNDLIAGTGNTGAALDKPHLHVGYGTGKNNYISPLRVLNYSPKDAILTFSHLKKYFLLAKLIPIRLYKQLA